MGAEEGDGRFDQLMAAARLGGGEALSALYREFQPAVLRYLRGTLGQDAEDAASEVWIDVARNLQRFAGDESGFRRWLFTIAYRRRVDALRARRPSTILDDAGMPPTVDPDVDGALWAADLIRRLPTDQAEIILLRVVGGLSAEEVGEMVGKSAGAVRVAAYRGLARLQRLVDIERLHGEVGGLADRANAQRPQVAPKPR